MQSISSIVQNSRRAGDGREATQCEETVLRNGQRLETGGGFLVGDGVCLSLVELLAATESKETGMSAENSYNRMLAKLLRERTLRSFAKCMKEWVLVV